MSITDTTSLSRLFETRYAKKPMTMEARQIANMEPTLPPLSSANLARNKTPPIWRLSPSKIQERRKRGLCFTCDENFTPSHRCKKLFFIKWIFVNEEKIEDDREEEWLVDSEHEQVISLHAIVGSTSAQTMRIRGVVKGHGITILLDIRSSHNFLNTLFPTAMSLPQQQMWGMKVTVANGEKLDCKGRCDGIQISLHDVLFTIDLFLLAIEGCDVGLDTQWIRTLDLFF